MHSKSNRIRRLIFLILPILIGVLIFFFFVKTKPEPPKKERVTNTRKVRVIKIEPMGVIPKTHGYGLIQPTNVWQAVAEVSGKIININPLLKKGQRVEKDTVLIDIDPTEYRLSVLEAEANLRSIEAQAKQLNDKELSTKELHKLELQTLKLKQKELTRQSKLVEDKFSSKSDYELAETNYIAQKYKVQSLQNTLNSLASDYELLKAQSEQAKIKLQSALLQLEYTKIKVPFTGLISTVNVERAQFIQKGQTVAEVENIDSVEIEAQVSNGLYVFRPGESEETRDIILLENTPIGEAFGIQALVKPMTGKERAVWQGKVMRFNASIDTKTRTPGIIIQVDDPFSVEADVLRRPLIKGMYCEIELFGRPFKDQIVVPRTAVHENNMVYVVDINNQLQFRTIEISFSQDSFTVIHSGLSRDDKVVITDVVPAVQGMSVDPVIDQAITQKIRTEANRGIK
ncbi:efflux RND transporter periplasmic adaptor subunit [bacterium]|nr:efflux RND transporter periplasmic adaptor subunit [bacterium]